MLRFCKNALDYLNNELGVDTSKRTPTHMITDEQREWLALRHDLVALKNSTGDTLEIAQLFGDLVFLNVMSVSETAELSTDRNIIDAAEQLKADFCALLA